MKNKPKYTEQQKEFIRLKTQDNISLEGKAGTGKTTAAAERIRRMLDSSNMDSVLVFSHTPRHQAPYMDIISKSGRTPEVSSYNAFVQKCLSLFWVLAADKAGFDRSRSPLFLNMDTEQIIMSRLIEKRINDGYFSALAGAPPRICNQIILAIHKCAAAMIPLEKYPEIMSGSWSGEKTFLPVFDRVLECGLDFTNYCKKNNLLDYSLQLDVFNKYILPSETFRKWIRNRRINFIFDNTEEEVPSAHHFVREMADEFKSILLISDSGAGYRSFMGGDTVSAEYLKDLCGTKVVFDQSFTQTADIEALEKVIAYPGTANDQLPGNPGAAYEISFERQFAKMIKNAVADVSDLIKNKGVDPYNIVILSPLVTDLIYTEMERGLRENGVKAYLHRPSRPITNEKVTKSLITLASLVVPEDGISVKPLDVVQMLQCFISDIDPIRCELYVSSAYDREKLTIREFSSLPTEVKQRFTLEMEERFEKIRVWIEKKRQRTEITPDAAVYEFFNEIMSKEGFESDELNALGVCKILDSMRRYGELMKYINRNGSENENNPGWKDFFNSVSIGAVKASYNEDIYAQPKDAVLISLVSTYFSDNRNDEYQVWLNIASPRWRNRFMGDLTNDIVLSRNWSAEKTWNTSVSEASNDLHMIKQACGLLRRCTKKVLAYSCEMDESGLPQKGKLLNVFSTVSRRFAKKI